MDDPLDLAGYGVTLQKRNNLLVYDSLRLNRLISITPLWSMLTQNISLHVHCANSFPQMTTMTRGD
jgi:hypothetical protein